MVYTYKILGNFGRLGNQLFQIASTLGIAFKNQSEASFPDWYYSKYFSIPKTLFDNKDGTDFSGDYLQDYHYFIDYDSLIKQYFSPSDQTQLALDALLNDLVEERKTNNIVSVHVRRGDYLHLPNHHPVCTNEYFEKAFDFVQKSIFDGFKIVIFSDDIEWCKQQSIFSEGIFLDNIKSYPDVFDLFAMTYCNAHVISNSTFSWWGAYLSGYNNVIYPDPWYGVELSNIDVDNTLIMPGWNKINR